MCAMRWYFRYCNNENEDGTLPVWSVGTMHHWDEFSLTVDRSTIMKETTTDHRPGMGMALPTFSPSSFS